MGQANTAVLTAFKEKLCEQFRTKLPSGATCDPSQIELSQGSVVVQMVLEAAAGTLTASSLNTPAPATLTAALKTIDNIAQTYIPGQSLSTSAVTALVFAAGATTGSSIAPPTAPTAAGSPSPAPAASTDDNKEVDGSVCASAMTSLILATGALN